VIITDKLKARRSKRDILHGVEHRQIASTTAENAHRPTRQQNGAGRGASHGHGQRFWRRMAPWPTTSAHDGMGCPRRRTAQRGNTAARVGPQSRVRAGRLSAGSVEIAPGKCLPLPGDHTSQQRPAASLVSDGLTAQVLKEFLPVDDLHATTVRNHTAQAPTAVQTSWAGQWACGEGVRQPGRSATGTGTRPRQSL
jgi:hypothetical protein